MIQYKKYTKAQGKEFIEEKDRLSQPAFDDLIKQWSLYKVDGFDENYLELRNKVVDVYKTYKDISDYEVDLRIGICIYEELNEAVGFTNVVANDDDVWRYLSCIVFPDITHMRYPPSKTDLNDGHRLNTKRFYLHTRRIWLKTLWWYIHLSWQGTSDLTYSVLKHFGTDTISDLFERPGKGYRLSLYRELMKDYSQISSINADNFNKIQKQNLVNCRTVEPALTDGGEEGYVLRLLEQLSLA